MLYNRDYCTAICEYCDDLLLYSAFDIQGWSSTRKSQQKNNCIALSFHIM